MAPPLIERIQELENIVARQDAMIVKLGNELASVGSRRWEIVTHSHIADCQAGESNTTVGLPVPGGTTLAQVWFTPQHNIRAINAFEGIHVSVNSPTSVNVWARGNPGNNMRITIYGLCIA